MKQITIIGTGLIGGSFALAVKKRGLVQRVVGCDRAEVLAWARELNAIDDGVLDPVKACEGSQLVVLATPVGGIIDLLEKVGPVGSRDVLITDVGSTKSEVSARARSVFGAAAAERFLPGHPMAGKEHSGIEYADADLFQGATWLFTTDKEKLTPDQKKFVAIVHAIGAKAVFLPEAEHDRLCAWVSHLQQFTATAMASALADFATEFEAEFAHRPELQEVGGRALREMTRIAASPYSMWRDVALTNTENVRAALAALEQKLAHLRENLRSPELRDEFGRANGFAKRK